MEINKLNELYTKLNQKYSFQLMDSNKDGHVTETEVLALAYQDADLRAELDDSDLELIKDIIPTENSQQVTSAENVNNQANNNVLLNSNNSDLQQLIVLLCTLLQSTGLSETELLSNLSTSGDASTNTSNSSNAKKDISNSLIDESLIIDDYKQLFDTNSKFDPPKADKDNGNLLWYNRLSSQAKKDLLLDYMETLADGGIQAKNEKFGGLSWTDFGNLILNSYSTQYFSDNYIEFSQEEYEKFEQLKDKIPGKDGEYLKDLFSDIEEYYKPQDVNTDDMKEKLLSGKSVEIPCAKNVIYDDSTYNKDCVSVKMVNGELIYTVAVNGGELNLNESQIQGLLNLNNNKIFNTSSYLSAISYLTGTSVNDQNGYNVFTQTGDEANAGKVNSFTNEQGETSSIWVKYSSCSCAPFNTAINEILKARAWVKNNLN